MVYEAEIRRYNPTLIILVLDQSGSMTDIFGGGELNIRKADFLADVVNRITYDLIMRCTKPEEVRNYYHVAIIGYGAGVGSIFGGSLSGRDFVPIADLADNPIRIETRNKKVPDGAGGLTEQQVKFPIWIDPCGNGGTPMCAALQQVECLLDKWYEEAEHKFSFPPTVLHITDGESTDGDPTEIGKRILSKGGVDGSVLFFNCHITGERGAKIEYPSSTEPLSNLLAKTLFNISSVLPAKFVDAGKQIGLNVANGSRGFVFNGDAAALVQFFDIGTRPANLR